MPRAAYRQMRGQTAVMFCDHCGSSIEDETGIHANGHQFCCDECAEAKGYAKCAHCGTYHHLTTVQGIQTEDEWFCDERCACAAGFERCAHCGQWMSVESETRIVVQYDTFDSREHHYCTRDCALNDGAVECEQCNRLFFRMECRTDSGMICRECANGDYYYCEGCGHYTLPENWNSRDERCCSCSDGEDENPLLHRYGYRPPTLFFGDTRQAEVPYLGVELETDADRHRADDSLKNRRDYCRALRSFDSKDRFWLTEDGSLTCGVEVTSQPMTLDEHIDSGLWGDVCKTALEHGFSSHDNGRCGLHIHVNRDYFGKSEIRQNAGGYNLAMLVSRFERQMTQFSRRKDNHWCAYGIHTEFMDKKNASTQSMSMFDKSQCMCEEKSYAHSQCVNFQHSATFELRIFRGTLRLATLYASLAMAQGLARAAKHHSQVWCETVDWYSLMDDIAANTRNETARTAFIEYLAERGVA